MTAIMAMAAGCASLPPAIDQGQYQNYRYGFVVQLPRDGWQITRTIPDRFAAFLVPDAPERSLLVLHNPRARGLIALRGGTLILSYENALNVQERLSEFIEPFLDLDRHLIVKTDSEIRGSYAVDYCNASGLQWWERAVSRPLSGIRHTSQGFFYPLKGEACYVTFYLFSESETYEDNVLVLRRMAVTFSSGEVFTSREFGW